MAKEACNKKKSLFTRKLDLHLRKKPVRCHILYGAETWTLRKVDQKYLKSIEMWCWIRMEKISWADHVRNLEVLQSVKEERNILQTRRKANWTGHILHRSCLLKHVTEYIEEMIEVMGRGGRRRH